MLFVSKYILQCSRIANMADITMFNLNWAQNSNLEYTILHAFGDIDFGIFYWRASKASCRRWLFSKSRTNLAPLFDLIFSTRAYFRNIFLMRFFTFKWLVIFIVLLLSLGLKKRLVESKLLGSSPLGRYGMMSKTALFEDLRIIPKSLFICGETAWKWPEAVSLGGDFRETRCWSWPTGSVPRTCFGGMGRPSKGRGDIQSAIRKHSLSAVMLDFWW